MLSFKLFPLVCALIIAPIALGGAAVADEDPAIDLEYVIIVGLNGNAELTATATIIPEDFYQELTAAPILLEAALNESFHEGTRIVVETNTSTLKFDDDSSQVHYSADLYGFAVARNGGWEIAGESEGYVATVGTSVVVRGDEATTGMAIHYNGTVTLPGNATGLTVDRGTDTIHYRLPTVAGTGAAQAMIRVEPQGHVMSAVYKLYADPKVEHGSFWVARTIIKNEGTAPMRDVAIDCRLGSYAHTGAPHRYDVVAPGGVVVDRYYPVIDAGVTALRSGTPAQLVVHVEYTDETGARRGWDSESTIELLGVHQLLWSTHAPEEAGDNFDKMNNNAYLLAAFVTPTDDAVKQFAGYISEAAGGAGASLDDDSAMAWLKAAYELQLLNDIVYQTPSASTRGKLGLQQDVKYPRDVLRDKAGTCVDLAVIYAALAESVGLHASLVVLDDHVFAAVTLPESGEVVYIDNVGLGGGDDKWTFSQAVASGTYEWEAAVKSGRYLVVDLAEERGEGRITNPELPPVGPEFLHTVGIKRMSQLKPPGRSRSGSGTVSSAR